MKHLFTKWLPALLISALLLGTSALMEDAAVESAPMWGAPLEASIPDDEAPVSIEAAEPAVEETEGDLDDDGTFPEETEVDLCDDGTGFAFDADVGAIEADSEPVFWEDMSSLDGDALFDGYVQHLFGLNRPMLFAARNVGGDLTGVKRSLYDTLSSCVVEIAAGRRASTEIRFSNAGGLSYEDVQDVVSCVIADHPYEMYWYASGMMVRSSGGNLTLSFGVGSNYAAGEYRVDTAAVARASTAAANARAIVNKYAALADYDKLAAYRDEICNAVSYNYDAASATWSRELSDPWQVIWVFDGDPSTNVVCEGYAKAFQYLCDMSGFSGNVVCCSVTGYIDGGAHEWNVVRMPNGRNYLVDVTTCDNDSGDYDLTFMKAPASGSMSSGYYFNLVKGNTYLACTYVYDDYALRIYSSGDLVLSAGSYLNEVNAISETVPGTTELTLGDDSDSTSAPAAVLTISATKSRSRATVYAVPGTAIQLDPGSATAKKFKSSKKKVATVSGAGLVTVRKAGKTKITFKVGRKKRTVTLIIKDPTVPTAITLNAYGTIAVKKGDTVTLTATLPEGTTSGIRWKSSNKKVATVSNGVVTFKKRGKVTITATATRGKKKARVKFKVSN